jgi:hypothetical protein
MIVPRMPISVVGIVWYREEDYPAILEIMTDREAFPKTFAVWRERATALELQQKARWFHVVRAEIDPNTFPEWCRARGLEPDARARKSFCDEEARRKGGS